MGYVATVSLIACPFVVSAADAMPTQGGFTASAKSGAETGKVAKTPVLARNTVAKPETASTTTPKEQKQSDKKAISRCWKRLMDMVREVNHAHKSKN